MYSLIFTNIRQAIGQTLKENLFRTTLHLYNCQFVRRIRTFRIIIPDAKP